MARFTRKSASATPSKQVKLKLVHIDFWSAVRTGFMITLGLAVATVVVFIGLYFVLVNPSIASLFSQVGVGEGGSLISLPQMISYGVTLGLLNVVAGTILFGLFAVVYNTIAKFTGGISVGFTNN